jgi:hypothetical protein
MQPRGDGDSNVFATLGKKLGGHPDRRTVMRSRDTIDDFDVKLSFTCHTFFLLVKRKQRKPYYIYLMADYR